MTKKSGFVTLIGRPNTGKSTLMNRICGKKIAIVTHVPQTTRNTIKGIYTEKNAQIVFLDTPGMHESAKLFNTVLNKQAEEAMMEGDIVLYLIDLTRPIGKEETVIKNMLEKSKKPIILAYNKVDVHTNTVVQNSLEYKEMFGGFHILGEHFISALKGKHVEELLDDIVMHLPEGEFYYPEGMYTDHDLHFLASEEIREKLMLHLHEELPHSIKVEVVHVDEESHEKVLKVFADIFVERDSQKGIVIGKGGQMLKKIGMEARKSLEDLFKKKIYLELAVKVDANWRTA